MTKGLKYAETWNFGLPKTTSSDSFKFVVYILAITMVNFNLFLQCIRTNVRLKKKLRGKEPKVKYESSLTSQHCIKDTKLNDGKCEQAGSF